MKLWEKNLRENERMGVVADEKRSLPLFQIAVFIGVRRNKLRTAAMECVMKLWKAH